MSTRVSLLLYLFTIATPFLQGQSAVGGQKVASGSIPRFDRHWWDSVHTEEKQGFVVGHEDCFVWEGRHARAKGYADQEFVKAIDSFFRDSNHSIYSVPRAMDLIAGVVPWPRAEAKPRADSAGENWNEPHWYLDGTWWRGGSDKEHLGYVEGYLACFAGLVKFRVTKRPPEWVKAIDTFYESKRKNESEKVGVVLMKLVASVKK